MTEKRKPGHPTMAPELKKRMLSTRLAPEWHRFLDELLEQGYTKASIINKGLELARAYIKEGGEI